MANQNRAIEFGLLFQPALDRRALDPGRADDPRAVRARPLRTADTARTAAALAAFAVGLPAFMLIKALTPGFFAREDTRTPLYIALRRHRDQRRHERRLRVRHRARAGRHRALLVALGLAQCRASAVVLMHRGHWRPDRRLISRTLRVALAAIGMGAALVGGLAVLRPPWRIPTCWASQRCSACALAR
jgi:putative peptidoglycan lipid II flippase